MKKNAEFATQYTIYETLTDLSLTDQELLQTATDFLAKAYAPYSGYPVAAAARLADQQIQAGANQENAAYPMCLCAERVVLGKVLSQVPIVPVDTLAIKVRKSGLLAAPCGACRQVLTETEGRFNRPIRLLLQAGQDAVYEFPTAAALLPFGFGPANL